MTQDRSNSIWPVIFIALVIGIIFSTFVTTSIKTQPVTFEPDRSSFEHRYVQERFKQEGYSGADASKAADAIIKFHNAQQARQR